MSIERKNSPGFTLLELLVVIAIIAILAALLLPVLSRVKERALGVQCLGNAKQLQLAWYLYTDDFHDFIPGNNWWMEAGINGMSRGPFNWLTGWEDVTVIDNTDNTNTALFLDPQWSSLGTYTKSAAIYLCPASRIAVKEGGSTFPLARTVAMNGWMGYTNRPDYSGFQFIRKTTDLVQLRPTDAFVFADERDDSVDDGFFAVSMVDDMIIDLPATYHGGSGPVTFADGHVELHRWLNKNIRFLQQASVAAEKYNLINVAADDPDLAWLRDHATRPE